MRKILIIDDEPEIRELLKLFFEDSGFKTEGIENGIAAIDYIKKKTPDLIVTDLLLPGEHGINIIETITKQYFIPTIIISGIYSEDNVSDVIENNFIRGFFKKPLNLNQLLKVVNTILDE